VGSRPRTPGRRSCGTSRPRGAQRVCVSEGPARRVINPAGRNASRSAATDEVREPPACGLDWPRS
jgi:hypothetical protein